MPDAFDWLDRHLPQSLLAPDEAIDWIWIIDDEDHELLMAAWDKRPPEWREALAYVVGQGDMDYVMRILRRALSDEVSDVALQAVVSMHDLIFEHENCFSLEPSELAQLKVLQATAQGVRSDELRELIERLDFGPSHPAD